MAQEIKFGTDGWRGIIADDFTFENVRRVAGAIASYVLRCEDPQRGVFVGYDARFASPRAAQIVAEVIAVAGIPVKLANEYLFPVTARGGGVGYTGGAVPVDGGIVIGTDRMKNIVEINVDDLYAICQPGLTTFELQQAVEMQGLMFAPDPASYKDSFIGGNIAENAGGYHQC